MNIITIGNHSVVQGVTPDAYCAIMANTVRPEDRDSYWDFPLSEMEDGTIEDNGCLYFEIEQAGEKRYFESALKKDEYALLKFIKGVKIMNTTKLTPETKIETVELAEKLLRAHGIYAEVYSDGPTDFCVDIHWGDWKHEHLAATSLMYNCLGLDETASWVTEENGSDCYSAVHRFTIPNDYEIPTFSMERLLSYTKEVTESNSYFQLYQVRYAWENYCVFNDIEPDTHPGDADLRKVYDAMPEAAIAKFFEPFQVWQDKTTYEKFDLWMWEQLT